MADTLTTNKSVEKLFDADKTVLDAAKQKRESALLAAKAAVLASENAELQHQNIVLQLALKYKLNEGDVIDENGEIKRK